MTESEKRSATHGSVSGGALATGSPGVKSNQRIPVEADYLEWVADSQEWAKLSMDASAELWTRG